MEIDPQRWYSFSEAARLIPSCRGGAIHPKTLWGWHRDGVLTKGSVVSRQTGLFRAHLFISGAEVLRLALGRQPQEVNVRTPTDRRREVEAARRRFEELSCRQRSAKGAASPGPGRSGDSGG